jgi:hypothetical protein
LYVVFAFHVNVAQASNFSKSFSGQTYPRITDDH